MANYYGRNVTNYFKVKNRKKLKRLAEQAGFEIHEELDKTARVAILDSFGRYGISHRNVYTLYSDEDMDSYYDEDKGEWVDIIDDFREILADNEVIVIMHVGAEEYSFLSASYILITKDKCETREFFEDMLMTKLCDTDGVPKFKNHNMRLWY